MLTHYDVLGVAYDADRKAIVKAYEARRQALNLDRHDAHGQKRRRIDGELGRLENAYRTLSDPSTRDRYDESLAERSSGAEPTPSLSTMTIKDFYSDPARAASVEVDFGSQWRRDGVGPWKVVWLEATGELVAINEGGPDRHGGVGLSGGGSTFADLAIGVALDAAIDGLFNRPQAKRVRYEVVVLAIEPDGGRLRRVLDGWQKHMADADGLRWLAEHA